MARPWLVLLLAALWSPAARAQSSEEALRFHYQAAASCPDVEAFMARVRERTARGRPAAPGELARSFAVSLTPDRTGFMGEIRFVDDGGAQVSRRVHGEQCDAVVSSLALITALALDAALRPRDEEPSAAPSKPLPPPPRATPSRPGFAAAPPPKTRPPRGLTGVRVGISGGYGGAEHAARLGLLGQLDWRSGWSLRLIAHYGSDSFVGDDQGRRAQLRIQGVETSVCPWRWQASQLSLSPCALVDFGSLRVRGVGDEKLTSPGADTIWWGLVGAELRLAWLPRAPFWLEARAAAELPLRAGYRFTFYNPQKVAYEVPSVAGAMALAAGVRF